MWERNQIKKETNKKERKENQNKKQIRTNSNDKINNKIELMILSLKPSLITVLIFNLINRFTLSYFNYVHIRTIGCFVYEWIATKSTSKLPVEQKVPKIFDSYFKNGRLLTFVDVVPIDVVLVVVMVVVVLRGLYRLPYLLCRALHLQKYTSSPKLLQS